MATQTETSTKTTIAAKGKITDLNQNAYLDKWQQPTPEDEYDHAVELVKTRLDKLSPVQALFAVNMGPNHPDLIIDARGTTTPTMIQVQDNEQSDNLDCKVFIKPIMVQRFVDGIMEARYALNYGHIFTDGPTRVGVKFVDGLTPFGAVHPKLNKTMLHKLPKPTEDKAQVKKDLKEFGYALVKNALNPDELQKLQKRLKEQAQGEADAGVGFFDGGEARPNQRIWNLPNKGQEFLDLLDTNKVIKDYVPDFLGDDAILFSYTANIARPGNTPMHLHTDQITIQPPIRDVAFGLNLMYFLTDITPSNGGTLVMPGSHKGNLAPDDPYDVTDTVAAEGPAGTCMVFESRIWHATGSNTTPGSERPVIIVFFMRAYVRPQENYFLSLLPEVEANATDRVKAFLGYRSSGSIGGVEGKTRDGTIVKRPEKPIGVLGGQSVPLHSKE